MRKRPLVLEKYSVLVSSSPCRAKSPRVTCGWIPSNKTRKEKKDFCLIIHLAKRPRHVYPTHVQFELKSKWKNDKWQEGFFDQSHIFHARKSLRWKRRASIRHGRFAVLFRCQRPPCLARRTSCYGRRHMVTSEINEWKETANLPPVSDDRQ